MGEFERAFAASTVPAQTPGLAVGEVAWPGAPVSAPPTLAPVFMEMDLAGALRWGMWGAVFSFMFVDLFDSVGTIVACSYEAGRIADVRFRGQGCAISTASASLMTEAVKGKTV